MRGIVAKRLRKHCTFVDSSGNKIFYKSVYKEFKRRYKAKCN